MEDSPKYRGLRQQLVALLQQKGIKDAAVLEAMGIVPRHWFMDKGLTAFAYEDNAYPIAADQTISQPYTVAFQTQLLELQPGAKVLEIGTGSGYQTAVLLQLGATVYTVERQQTLFKKTQRLFQQYGYRPKQQVFGDGYKGLATAAPYDAILVTAGAPKIPQALLAQLALGGHLVIPVGTEEQVMTRFTRTSETTFDKKTFGVFRFVPLLEDKN